MTTTENPRTVSRQWFITTETFARGGIVVAGPFTTATDALNAREAIERLTNDLNYWIDSKDQA